MSDDNLPILYGRPVRGEHFTGRVGHGSHVSGR